MSPAERDNRVAQLLAELERVDENVRTARQLCMSIDEAKYRQAAKALLNQANAIDPSHLSPAWRL